MSLILLQMWLPSSRANRVIVAREVLPPSAEAGAHGDSKATIGGTAKHQEGSHRGETQAHDRASL